MATGFLLTLCDAGPARLELLGDAPASELHPLVRIARDAQTGTTAVVLGQILYRAEHADRLGLHDGDDCDDARLALAAYLHRGVAGLARLEGEFACVLYDAPAQRLLALRDPCGNWPLYYAHAPTGVLVSSSLQAVAARSGHDTLDRRHAAEFLVFPYANVEPNRATTAFGGCERILPGCVTELRCGRAARTLSSWDWLGDLPEAPQTADEAAAGLRAVFAAAVRTRIARGRVAAHFSGGLDSSAVLAVAAAEQQGLRPRIAALSLVYEHRSLRDEQQFMRDVLDHLNEPVAWRRLDGDAALDFDWFGAPPPRHDEPYAGLFRLALERTLVAGAAESGASTILTGVGADDILDGNRFYLADLLRQGRLPTLLREARRWSEGGRTSLAGVLCRAALAPLCPARLAGGWRAFLRGGRGAWPELGLFSIPPWIAPALAKEHDLWGALCDAHRRMHRGRRELSGQLFGLTTSVGNWSAAQLAGPLGLHTSHPFLDPRVVRYCWSVPRALREQPGAKKPLLQAALRGILPESVRLRRVKRSFNAVYWEGLLARLPQLEALVRRSELAGQGIFDAEELVRCLRQHALGIGGAMAGGRLNSLLALCAWHEQVQRDGPHAPPVREVRRLGRPDEAALAQTCQAV